MKFKNTLYISQCSCVLFGSTTKQKHSNGSALKRYLNLYEFSVYCTHLLNEYFSAMKRFKKGSRENSRALQILFKCFYSRGDRVSHCAKKEHPCSWKKRGTKNNARNSNQVPHKAPGTLLFGFMYKFSPLQDFALPLAN